MVHTWISFWLTKIEYFFIIIIYWVTIRYMYKTDIYYLLSVLPGVFRENGSYNFASLNLIRFSDIKFLIKYTVWYRPFLFLFVWVLYTGKTRRILYITFCVYKQISYQQITLLFDDILKQTIINYYFILFYYTHYLKLGYWF